MTPAFAESGGASCGQDEEKEKRQSRQIQVWRKTSKIGKRLEDLANNRLVADIVAAALVATASALKDRKRRRPSRRAPARSFENLAKEGAERGNAMWKLALEVGRRAIDTIAGDEAKPATKSKSKAKAKAKAKAKGKAAKPVSKSGRTSK